MKATLATSAGKVVFNTDPLAALRNDIARHAKARVQIGVIGDTARFEELGDTTLNNAELGMIHEFGVIGGIVKHKSRSAIRKKKALWDQFKDTVNIPERSFLRMPLIKELPDAIYKTGVGVWRRAIIEKGLLFALKNLGILGEATVQDAFNTGGFGHWPALKPSTIRMKMKKGRGKDAPAILIDTAQLRQSVTSRVVTK